MAEIKTYKATFEQGITVTYSIEKRDRYWVFEAIEVIGDPDKVSLGRLSPNNKELIGAILGGYRNEDAAVYWVAINNNVDTRAVFDTSYLDAQTSSKFGHVGHKVALVVCRPDEFHDIIAEIQTDFNIPITKIGGVDSKLSEDKNYGYIFSNLTLANLQKHIDWAKQGGFKYIVPYAWTWAESRGSWKVRTDNYTGADLEGNTIIDPEEGLKYIANKLEENGLKLGLHAFPLYIQKVPFEPMVQPPLNSGLHIDSTAILATDIDTASTTIVSVDELPDKFPRSDGYYNDEVQGMYIKIGNEIIEYTEISTDNKTFTGITRGALDTPIESHPSGSVIEHLTQRHTCFIVDLSKSELPGMISDRFVELATDYGVKMFFFDGGDSYSNVELDEYFHWGSIIQMDFVKKLYDKNPNADMLMQGSGATEYSWHGWTRMVCDDMAHLATKEFLDFVKIPDKLFGKAIANFMPAELGWWGILEYDLDHPATMPDEVELHAIRMLAYDTPISLQTWDYEIESNGRSNELLNILGTFEAIRHGNREIITSETRDKLKSGEWNLIENSSPPQVKQVTYKKYDAHSNSTVVVNNSYVEQPLSFRLYTKPVVDIDNTANILLDGATRNIITPVPFTVGKLIIPQAFNAKNLTNNRTLGVTINVQNRTGDTGVINLQLGNDSGLVRDHLIDLDFDGEKTVIINTNPERSYYDGLMPDPVNYYHKRAISGFDYSQVTSAFTRLMRPPGSGTVVTTTKVQALKEIATQVTDPEIKLGSQSIKFPTTLDTGDYIEFIDGQARVFTKENTLKETITPIGSLALPTGDSTIEISTTGDCPIVFELVTFGNTINIF